MNNWSDIDASSFFRIITLTDVREGKLGLPKKFIHEYANELSNAISLRVPSDGIWHIGIEREEDMLWLHDGWQRFAEHQSIKCGYFLLFKYKGNSEFDVSIFDLTATEINYPCSTNSNERMFSNVAQATFVEQEKLCGHSDDQPIEISDSSDNEKQTEDVNPGSCWTWPNRKKLGRRGPPIEISDSSDNEKQTEDVNPGSRWTFPNRKKLGRRGVLDDDKMWELHVAKRLFKSDNPYFTAVMRRYNLVISSIVSVPTQFSKTYLHDLRHIIEIHDSDNKKWNVHIVRSRSNGRVTSLSKGWSHFVKEKELCLGDVCVFELIKSTPVALKVSIFRAKERKQLN